MDIVRRIRSFNAGRDPERLRLKYRAMRGSPFAFLRGTCHLFYDRLPREAVFKFAPLAWLCGDLHLENFGSYKGDNRLVYFDLNDFDEGALAPVSWDLVRLLASLMVGAEGLAITGNQAQTLCRTFLDAYGTALALGKAFWVERETAQGLVRSLLDGLQNRSRARFLDLHTTARGKKRLLRVDGKKALAASAEQRSEVVEFMQTFAKAQAAPGFFKVLDVARRIAGTGSLGVDRYAILVEGKGSPDGNYLLDMKQALPSALLARLRVVQPSWRDDAHRAVALQRRAQAVSMAFLQPVLLGERPFVLRGMQPSEDRIALRPPGHTMADVEPLIATMGMVVAWAHLRGAGRNGSAIADELIAFGQRRKWKDQLLAAADGCAARTRKDAATFNAAFDEGAFDG